MEIVWTSPARRDLDRHVDYIARQNPAAALRVDDAIREAVERLADQPHRGRPGQRVGTRELVIAEFPAYLVVYRLTETEVRILRVWHGRQNWRR
jgi:addiction module RelE/StbE family toxin